MQPLGAAQLLELCERGQGKAPVRQAFLMLQAASPDEPAERLAGLPVGRRDARLLELRACTFGPVLETETRCPACEERLEFELASDHLNVAPGVSLDGEEPLTAHHEGYAVRFRLPTSEDVLAVGDGDGADARLLARCVVEAEHHGATVAAGALPAFVVQVIGEAMTAADPLTDAELALTCPACAHSWSVPFDPAAFFWAEIEAWVPRVLRDVHVLASAYGWSEHDILAMSAARRGRYLDLVGA